MWRGEIFDLDIENVSKGVLGKEEVDSMIELHIEQGAVLERQHKSIGIAQAIAGMKTFKVTLERDSNHAGTISMDLRHDPLVGTAKIISNLRKAVKTVALPTTVVTVALFTMLQ